MSHVLIAVRNDDIRLLLEQMVDGILHWTFDSAASSQMALAIITREAPDLVIADLAPPEMDGIELLHRLQNHPSYNQIPVVLVGTPEHDFAARSAGCHAFLVKPFRMSVLLAVLLILSPQGAPG